jgi:hypothetical protein
LNHPTGYRFYPLLVQDKINSEDDCLSPLFGCETIQQMSKFVGEFPKMGDAVFQLDVKLFPAASAKYADNKGAKFQS